MKNPSISRPHFPEGYLAEPKSYLSWPQVQEQFSAAIHYWVCTVTPDQHPHVVPKWGVWVNDHFYFDGSPQTRHARNLKLNPAVAVHLESGEQPVILNGTCQALDRPGPKLANKLAQRYSEKYTALGYTPSPDQWDNGGLFEVTPQTVLAWTKFTEDPTKFTF
jgi:nitroimidazol reductase NimA-like FMN-containing flavoprotein (pyridoxamine 5'-phosphate oxidase superfamily)